MIRRKSVMILIACWLLGVWPIQASFASAQTSLQTWQKAMNLYNAYEFEKSSAEVRKVLQQPPLRWKDIDKAYALVILSICQFNLARIKLARRIYEDALRTSREVITPSDLPENIKAKYLEYRAKWMQQHPIVKKNSVLEKIRKQEKEKRLRKLARLRKKTATKATKVTKAKKARKVRTFKKPQKRKVTRIPLRKAPLQPPPPSRFRYVGTVVMFSLAGAALATAIGLGVASASHTTAIQQISPDAPDSANTAEQSYQSALSTGIAATIMWIAAPVLGGVGVGLLVYESRRPKKENTTRITTLSSDHTPAFVAVSGQRKLLFSTP